MFINEIRLSFIIMSQKNPIVYSLKPNRKYTSAMLRTVDGYAVGFWRGLSFLLVTLSYFPQLTSTERL